MKNNKKFSSGILVLIIIAVAAVLLAVAQIVTTFASPSGFERKSKNKSVSNSSNRKRESERFAGNGQTTF